MSDYAGLCPIIPANAAFGPFSASPDQNNEGRTGGTAGT